MLERFRGDRVRSGYGGGSVHLYKYHITMSGAAEQRMGHLQSLLRSWPVLLKGTMIHGDAGNNPKRGGENRRAVGNKGWPLPESCRKQEVARATGGKQSFAEELRISHF